MEKANVCKSHEMFLNVLNYNTSRLDEFKKMYTHNIFYKEMTLYKYLDINLTTIEKINNLIEGNLFTNLYENFNDPFDCEPLRWVLGKIKEKNIKMKMKGRGI